MTSMVLLTTRCLASWFSFWVRVPGFNGRSRSLLPLGRSSESAAWLCRRAHLFNPFRIAVSGGAQKVAVHSRVLDVQ